MKDTFLSKVILFMIAILLLAYLVMFNKYAFQPLTLRAADRSIAVYIVHVYLLTNYVLLINALMNQFDRGQIAADSPTRRHYYGLFFMFIGLFVVVMVHNFFLVAGLQQLQEPYILSLICLFFTLLMVSELFCCFPKTRLLDRVDDDTYTKGEWQLLLLWRENSDPSPVLPYLRKQYAEDVALVGSGYRMLDVVFIECVDAICFAHFLDGQVWMINYSKKEFQQAQVSPWFVKMSQQRYVNMLYVCYPIQNKKRLYLRDDISLVLFKGDQKREEEFLVPSRRLQKNINDFMLRCAELELVGWDEPINLKL